MPLIKRNIEPVDLSRSSLAPGIRNELECVTNNTLANVIKQLSSLSQHAEDMFGELFNDASDIFERANSLQERVDRLKVKVTQLDSTVEEVSLQDINMRKPFKSSMYKDAQVITAASRPRAMVQMYKECDAPPPLSKLNPYREDGKDSMKFYTDPTYFFELWCHEMTHNTELQKKELRKRKKQRPKSSSQRGPQRVREVKSRKDEYQRMAMGKEFIPEGEHDELDDESPSRPNSLELHSPGQYADQGQYGYPNGMPPPGYEGHQYSQQQQQQQPMYNHNHNEYVPGTEQAVPSDMASPQQTPTKGGRITGNRNPANLASPRPSQPPPAPPGMRQNDSVDMGSRSGSASRESLPPPPPPPPGGEGNSVRGTPPYTSPAATPGHMARMAHISHFQQRESPIRQAHSPSPALTNKSSTPDSIDLPPPPPPPPLSQTPDTPGSMSSMPPPPPTPPPMSTDGHHDAAPPPPPPPPPPQGEDGGKSHMPMANGVLHAPHLMAGDGLSLTSNMSSATGSSGSTQKSEEKPSDPIQDERSDLLAAIRQGILLRKVEDRRVKEEQRKHPVGGLDVQSIMEAAFEMRRKALEANDESEEEEGDSDVVWDSEEDC